MKIQRTAAIVLGVMMCIHIILLSFYYPLAKMQCRNVFLKSLTDESSTVNFVFTQSQLQSYLIDKEELNINGEWFDIICIEQHGDFVNVTCKADQYENYISEWFHHLITSKQKQGLFATVFIWTIPSTLNELNKWCALQTELCYSEISEYHFKYNQKTIMPPEG